MKNLKTYKELFESNFTVEQNNYEIFEKGLIMAWGDAMYLSYHNLPQHISKKVSLIETKKQFELYYSNSEDDEDLQDWMSDSPPTMNNGVALYDKQLLDTLFSNIANKTRLKKELTVYRVSTSDTPDIGWNSYSIKKNHFGVINTNMYEYVFILPKGFPVIFADGLADNDEVILKLEKSDIEKYQK
jgi:hypothetical protein